MEDGVRTTQEQLSAHPFDEALNMLKLAKKYLNSRRSAIEYRFAARMEGKRQNTITDAFNERSS